MNTHRILNCYRIFTRAKVNKSFSYVYSSYFSYLLVNSIYNCTCLHKGLRKLFKDYRIHHLLSSTRLIFIIQFVKTTVHLCTEGISISRVTQLLEMRRKRDSRTIFARIDFALRQQQLMTISAHCLKTHNANRRLPDVFCLLSSTQSTLFQKQANLLRAKLQRQLGLINVARTCYVCDAMKLGIKDTRLKNMIGVSDLKYVLIIRFKSSREFHLKIVYRH